MVNFLIEPSKTALLIVDMQNVFVEGSPVSAPEGPQVLDHLNRLAGLCHEVGIQVIYTAHVVRPDHTNMGILGDLLPPVRDLVHLPGVQSVPQLHTPTLDLSPYDQLIPSRRTNG